MRPNLAARLGGWSTRHRRAAIGGWLLFVVALAVIGGTAGQKTLKEYEVGAGDSARADRILAEAGLDDPATELVLLHTSEPGAWAAAASEVSTGLRGSGHVADIAAPLVSADRRDALVRFDLTGTSDDAAEHAGPVLAAVEKVRAAHPDVEVLEFGDASFDTWLDHVLGHDFARAEWTAVPLALGILLVAFGALVAAFVPVALAVTAFIAATGLLALATRIMPVADSTGSVMLLMGLAVGVDYCLFYLRREREERAAGRDAETSLRIAAATSGHSVLVSGVTVMLAMGVLFLSGLALFEGFALATILVVGVAMLGSVTVLPAVLSWLGDRVERGRPARLIGRRASCRVVREGRVVGALLRRVVARPRVAVGLGVGALVLLAAPALGMHTEQLGIQKMVPKGDPLAVAYDRITAAFPGGPSPARVVLRVGDASDSRIAAGVAALRTAVAAAPEFGHSTAVTEHREAGIVTLDVPLAGDGSDAESRDALTMLREEVVPTALGPAALGAGSQVYVTGELAGSVDFDGALSRALVPVLLFLGLVTFVLMLLAFRSPVIAATAIGLNLLSVAAAFGVLTAMFQHGWGAGLVGTEGVGAIQAWIPLFVLVVLFGLSMDYHVFVVSRIREARATGLGTTEAVRVGVARTAGAVTSAAAIMVAVFSVFATLSMQDFKQLGVGLGVAILLDATVIRIVLLPAVMILLGERNWAGPRRRCGPAGRGEGPPPAQRKVMIEHAHHGPQVASSDRDRNALLRSAPDDDGVRR